MEGYSFKLKKSYSRLKIGMPMLGIIRNILLKKRYRQGRN